VFQIADDVLDLTATSETLGKPAGSDIHEGKFTMPLLLALRGPDRERIHKLLDQPRPYPGEAVDEVIDLVRRGGYVDQTIDSALDRLERADLALSSLPDLEALPVLRTVGRYLVDRVASRRA
jgi:heptaprenyl diphosphate synthase